MKPSVRRMLALLARHRRPHAVGVACLLATNALNLLVPWLLKVAFDGIQAGCSATFLAKVAGAMAAVAVVRSVARTWSRMAILGTSRRVVAELREEVFAHLQRLPVETFDRVPIGDVVSRVINDLLHVRSLYGPVAMNFANTLALYAMAVVLLLKLDVVLTLVAVVPYVVVAVVVKQLGRRMHAESTLAQEALSRISSRLSEDLNGITVIKSYRREDVEVRRFDALADEYYEANQRFARTRSLVVPVMGSVGSLGTLAVLWLGGIRVMDGGFLLGDFVAFTATLAMLSWPSIALGWILNAFQRGVAAMDRIEALLAEPTEPAPKEGESRLDAGAAIELRACTFRHPSLAGEAARRPALDAVSFRVEPGGRLGIVGRTGSGKSTIVEILAGLRRPEPGQVFLDGRDLCDVPLQQLRRQVGLVPQGAFVFSTTVRENVAYGMAPDAPPADVETAVTQAVRDAAFEQDLPQLPRGLDTVLGERGVTLSGGQRQRVTLARALAVGPRLLLLDDSLSAVDTQTERLILDRLDARRRHEAPGARTTEVVVSHRLSAVADCDEILVLEDGAVVERGTHAELLAREGRYARTWADQELARELSEVE